MRREEQSMVRKKWGQSLIPRLDDFAGPTVPNKWTLTPLIP